MRKALDIANGLLANSGDNGVETERSSVTIPLNRQTRFSTVQADVPSDRVVRGVVVLDLGRKQKCPLRHESCC